MKKLNITKEQFNRSNYFQRKYGKLEYVSESGKAFKTNKGKVLMFNEAKGIRRSGKKTLVGFSDDNWLGIPGVVDSDDVIIYKGNEVPKGDLYEYLADDFPEFADLEGDEEEAWLRAHKKEVKEMIKDMAWAYDEYEESSKKFGKKFNEAVHPHETDADVPVTEQEKMLCDYIADEIEGELNDEIGLELTCGCSWHNPGEEQHIEIFVGIPEGDDPMDPKYENIETFLEQFVNKIGDAENDGEKWGDASFQWISDQEIFGTVYPLD